MFQCNSACFNMFQHNSAYCILIQCVLVINTNKYHCHKLTKYWPNLWPKILLATEFLTESGWEFRWSKLTLWPIHHNFLRTLTADWAVRCKKIWPKLWPIAHNSWNLLKFSLGLWPTSYNSSKNVTSSKGLWPHGHNLWNLFLFDRISGQKVG